MVIANIPPSSRQYLVDTDSKSYFCDWIEWFSNFQILIPKKVPLDDKDSKSDILGVGDNIFSMIDSSKIVPMKLLKVFRGKNLGI